MSDESPHEHLVREARQILVDREGKANAISSQAISARLGGLDNLDSTPRTRAVIREVIDRYRLPIAGGPDGYYVCADREEYRDAQETLSARIAGIEDRKRLLAEAWADGPVDDAQTSLPGAEASRFDPEHIHE